MDRRSPVPPDRFSVPQRSAQAWWGSPSIKPGARRRRTPRSTFKTSLPRRWRGVPASPSGEMRGNPAEALSQPLLMVEHALAKHRQRREPVCLQVDLPSLLFHLLDMFSFCLLSSVCGVLFRSDVGCVLISVHQCLRRFPGSILHKQHAGEACLSAFPLGGWC